ncbi:agmatinase [Candidatus Uhrbacteria bacterium]|nr:agmatinase [Candidatus Uhrbacteria bacterium]
MHHFKPPYNFLGLDPVVPKNADVVIGQIPYDGTTSYQPGARFGPRAILDASRQVEFYDLELKRDVSAKVKIATLPELAIDLASTEANVAHIASFAESMAKQKKFLITLGGEHSITPGLVQPLAERYKNDLTILQIDAHTDMREEYEGTKWNHACAMKRCRDLGVSVVHVGIRNSAEEEQKFIDPKNVFYAPEVPVEKILARITTKNVYLSIDVDGFDPAFVPSTGTPEPGGLGWYDVLRLFRALTRERKLVGADVVELAPIPGLVAPDFFVAKLVYKIIGYKFFK